MGVNLLGKHETDYDLHAELYDVLSPGLEGDVAFYVEEAQRAGGPVLELAVGTGRVAIPTALAGIDVVGLDSSDAMLAVARRKAEAAGLKRKQLALLRGDMRDFKLEQRFPLITIPYRAFLHLHTPEDQLRALRNIHAHLAPGGRLALNFFMPDLQIISAHLGPLGTAYQRYREARDEASGRTYILSSTRTYFPHNQMIHEYFVAEELDSKGLVVSRRYIPLRLRWMYPFEFEHLLARAGFTVESLYGWFDRRTFNEDSREMVWIASPSPAGKG